MNPDLSHLHPYPFEKLRQLFEGITPNPNCKPIALSIGEPKHEPPQFVLDKLSSSLGHIPQYPTTAGTETLRKSIADWLSNRFHLKAINQQQIIPVNGTREALFAIAQAVIDRSKQGYIVFPNPFYQIYEGAALLAGATPLMANCDETTGLADFSSISDQQWSKTQLVYLCSPGNPTGAVIPKEQLQELINKAQKYNFVIASDECYSEIYYNENKPPVGLLEAAAAMGNHDFKHCLVFHSLSKRSNLPGLRSGFVAGDETLIQLFLKYRTYHGCAMSIPTQMASALAWSDETHVKANRDLYRQKFDTFAHILNPGLNIKIPEASFYLWPELPVNGELFAQELYRQHHITVLPSTYLSRENPNIPGINRVRMALVSPVADCENAAYAIKQLVDSFNA